MNQISLLTELRDCPHCKATAKLQYYREGNKEFKRTIRNKIIDEYYCLDCYKISIWDGEILEPINAEAYINR